MICPILHNVIMPPASMMPQRVSYHDATRRLLAYAPTTPGACIPSGTTTSKSNATHRAVTRGWRHSTTPQPFWDDLAFIPSPRRHTIPCARRFWTPGLGRCLASLSSMHICMKQQPFLVCSVEASLGIHPPQKTALLPVSKVWTQGPSA